MLRREFCLLLVLFFCTSLLSCANQPVSDPEVPSVEEQAQMPEQTKTIWLLDREITEDRIEVDYTYDEHGRLIQEIGRNAYGEEEYSHFNTYNAEGQLIRLVTKNTAYPEGFRTLFTYDKNGNMIESSAETGERETCRYDDQGRIVEKSHYFDGSEQCAWRMVWEYNADGTKSDTLFQYQKDGAAWYISKNMYGADGRVSFRVLEHPLDGKVQKSKFERTFDEFGRVLTVAEVDENGAIISYKTTYFYDAEGRVSKREMVFNAGITDSETFRYDENGNLELIMIENTALESTKTRQFQYQAVELSFEDAQKIAVNEYYPKMP